MSMDISQYSRLPSLPTTALEVVRLFNNPECPVEQLLAVIRSDPAIVGKLLKAANSAEYGVRGQVTDLKRAVVLLGRNTVTPLVLSFSLAQQSMGVATQTRWFEAFWERSFFRATAAEILCGQMGSDDLRGESYTTCLLAGIGRLALLKAEPALSVALLQRAEHEQLTIEDLETETFGFNHRQLSAALLQTMGLPERVVVAVQQLCEDTSNGNDSSTDATDLKLSLIVRTSDTIARFLCDGDRGAAIVTLEETLELLELQSPLTGSGVIALVRDRVDVTASLFEIKSDRLPPAGDLLQIALDQLSSFAVQAATQHAPQTVPRELVAENGRLKRRVADLLRVSQIDSLTGVNNREFLRGQLAERVAVSAMRKESIALAVIDIDHFKRVNDQFGHLAGDKVLKAVASALTDSAREGDLVARFGGEEFVVVIEHVDAAALLAIGERFRTAIAAASIDIDSRPLSVTASVGLCSAQVSADHTKFALDLFASADEAMYTAKRSGRDRVVVGQIRSVEQIAIVTDQQDVRRDAKREDPSERNGCPLQL
jgi:diguanylate cyclase (GGDEF)-like protein